MKSNYHLFSHGSLERKDNTISFIPNEGDRTYIPVNDVEAIYAHGQVDVNTRFLSLLNDENVCLHTFGWNGQYTGSYMPSKEHKSGSTVVAQVQSYTDSARRCEIAREFVSASIHNMLRNIQYYQNKQSLGYEDEVERLEHIESKLSNLEDVSEILGSEAESRKLYYRLFNDATPEEFRFTNREYNPPVDEMNALISFGNSLLYSAVLSAIRATALEPTISYLHEPGDRRHSLALDIADVFKPVIVDRMLFRLLNRQQVTHSDFEDELEGTYLTDSGRKTVVSEFEELMEETIEHPRLNRHVSYQHLLRLEAYKLKKHLLANESYEGFRRWW